MKSFFQSKTIWIALIQGAIAVVMVIQGQYPDLGGVLVVKSILDVVLRFVTNKEIV